jgi:hypothetical protein
MSLLRKNMHVAASWAVIGVATLVVYVNQPPVGGTCSLSAPEGGQLDRLVSLVDAASLQCSGWSDPEEQGIVSYTINSKPTYFLDKNN